MNKKNKEPINWTIVGKNIISITANWASSPNCVQNTYVRTQLTVTKATLKYFTLHFMLFSRLESIAPSRAVSLFPHVVSHNRAKAYDGIYTRKKAESNKNQGK
mmetsp:Transcript_5453/g.8309  ORF Transcript_5453/g.8309 Transcript_5453/m.8309 type:complete len:103 (-) Transcript_5453:591-899(-)